MKGYKKRSIYSATLIITLILNVAPSCLSNHPIKIVSNIQVVEYRFTQFEPHEDIYSEPIIKLNEKVWYKDSMAIEEVRDIKFVIDSKDSTVKQYPVRNFRFNNLRSRTIYEYGHFSDTSKVIRKYSYDDSTVLLTGGWNFQYKRNWDYSGAIETLSDTIIDKITYKRVQIYRGTEELPYIMNCYFRCDKIGTIFTLDPYISQTIGCPMTKLYHFSPMKKGLHISSEINFISDSLTKNELKVFNTWEKFAKENPVKNK